MTRKAVAVILLLFMLLHSKVIMAKGIRYVEVFDPAQDKVVKVVEMNAEIYNMVSSWIENIDGIYAKNDPVGDDGYAVRIPLEPSVKVHGKWLNANVSEVYIIVPENDRPFFMIFENENKLTCFPFTGDIDRLSKALDFKLKKN